MCRKYIDVYLNICLQQNASHFVAGEHLFQLTYNSFITALTIVLDIQPVCQCYYWHMTQSQEPVEQTLQHLVGPMAASILVWVSANLIINISKKLCLSQIMINFEGK